MKFLKRIKWNDVGERALKTFVEAFVATVAASDFLNLGGGEALKTALFTTVVSGMAAGLSAVWNMLSNIVSGGDYNEY